MKYNKKLNPYIISFLVSAVLSAAAVLAIKYYIPFSNETAGSYAVATIFGDSIKVFLIKILSVVACVLALITFLLRSRKRTAHKVFFPSFTIVFSVIWLLLPLLSSYTISRYTGSLITQTVTGIAIKRSVFYAQCIFCRNSGDGSYLLYRSATKQGTARRLLGNASLRCSFRNCRVCVCFVGLAVCCWFKLRLCHIWCSGADRWDFQSIPCYQR